MKRLFIWGAVAGYAVFVWWFVGAIETTGLKIENAWQEMSKPSPVPAAIIRFDGAERGLVVPSWKWLEPGGQWAYASPKAEPVSSDFEPKLEKLTVTYGDWISNNQADWRTIKPLEKMFAAAKNDGVELLVTSAYRSQKDQMALHDDSVARYGADWAAKYLEGAGKSEHQLGLAIDMTTYSPACKINFDNCSISARTAQWLAENGPKFGFVLRYPPGKEQQTGLAYESWHYRYLGLEASKTIEETGLTYDEVYQKLTETKR